MHCLFLFLLFLGHVQMEFVPAVLTGLIEDPTPRVGVITTPPGRLIPADCSGGGAPDKELHVVSANRALRAGVITVRVQRAAPVVLVLNSYCCSPVSWVVHAEAGTTIDTIVLTKPFDSTTAYTGVDVRGTTSQPTIINAADWPYHAWGIHYELPDDSTSAMLARASAFVGLPLTSFHGMDAALEFALGPAPGATPVCQACSNANEAWFNGACTCMPGFSDASCTALVSSSGFALQSVQQPDAVSNAVRSLFTATGTGIQDADGWKCRLRQAGGAKAVQYSGDAFLSPTPNSLSCQVLPGPSADSPLVPPGSYTLEFAHPSASDVWYSNPSALTVTVIDGVAKCAQASSCTECDKNSCVWCAPGPGSTANATQSCVPGAAGQRANGATWGTCSVYADGSTCPPTSMTLGGPTAWGKIRGGEKHQYSVTVDAGSPDVEVFIEADPVTNQDRVELYLVGPSGGAPTAPWTSGTADDATHLSSRALTNLEGGTLTLKACTLSPAGTWTLSVVGRSLFTYRVGVRRACSCGGSTGGSAPTLTSLTPALGPRMVLLGVDSTVTVTGSGFTAGALCRIQSIRCRPQYANDVGRDCSKYVTRDTCRGASLCEWAGLDHVTVADFKSSSQVVCTLPPTAAVFAQSADRAERLTPETLKVSIANDQCAYSSTLDYHLWMPIDFAALSDCPANCQRPNIDGHLLAPGATDVWRFNVSPGSAHAGETSAQVKVTIESDGGTVDAWLSKLALPNDDPVTSTLDCDEAGSALCTQAVKSNAEYKVARCDVSPDVWLLAVTNTHTEALAYAVAVECGCSSSGTGGTVTTAVSPAAGVLEGFDEVTVSGTFKPDLATQCFFAVGQDLPVAVLATFIDSTKVRCLAPALQELTDDADGPAEASVYVGGVGDGFSACDVSRVPLSYYYSKPLFTKVPVTGQTLGDQPLVFVLDFGEVLGNDQADLVKSFKVTGSLQGAISQFRILVKENELPDLSAEEPAARNGAQTVTVCNAARTSRWFIAMDVLASNVQSFTLEATDVADDVCGPVSTTPSVTNGSGDATSPEKTDGNGNPIIPENAAASLTLSSAVLLLVSVSVSFVVAQGFI